MGNYLEICAQTLIQTCEVDLMSDSTLHRMACRTSLTDSWDCRIAFCTVCSLRRRIKMAFKLMHIYHIKQTMLHKLWNTCLNKDIPLNRWQFTRRLNLWKEKPYEYMQKHCVAFNVVKACHQPILANVSNWQKRIIVSKVYIGNWYEPLKVMKTKFYCQKLFTKILSCHR